MCAGLSTVAAACVDRGQDRTGDILKLQIGMTRDEVLSIMGQPQRREIYDDVEFLIYQTDSGADEAWNFTPVGFIDGRVTGWGRVYYERAKGSAR